MVAIGANLSGIYGPPLASCQASIEAMRSAGLAIVRRSRWFQSSPVPPSSQNAFINGVVLARTWLPPDALMVALHEIECLFGRRRSVPNAARSLDLDLLAYGAVVSGPGTFPVLPHPRLHQRRFVLVPLADVAPQWRHPVMGRTVTSLLAEIEHVQECQERNASVRPLTGQDPPCLPSATNL